MIYAVECECGGRVEVAQGAAGTRVACPCGRDVVPSLSELRRKTGEPAYGDAIRAVQVAVREGRLPEDGACPGCGAAKASELVVPVIRCSLPETVTSLGLGESLAKLVLNPAWLTAWLI